MTSRRLIQCIVVGSLILLSTACERPAIRPRADNNGPLISAPIILVGRITALSNAGGPRHFESGGISYKAQLVRATVATENVLRGQIPTPNATIYYFVPASSYDGSPLLWMPQQWAADSRGNSHGGVRAIFFLLRESGVLRTICDFHRHCVVPIQSCDHPEFRLDPSKPLAQTIIDLLLTRGAGCGNQQMIEAISKFNAENLDRQYAFKKLRQLAAEETPPVRDAACHWLSLWKQPCVAPRGS